jgi:hypothetical protein
MFGSKKSITDRVKDSLTDYLDVKFEDYRGQIALDLARGIGALAGLVAIWSVAIIAGMFFSIAIALLLGWAFSFFMESFAYTLSFLLVSIFLFALAAFIIKYKEKYIVTPVFDLMATTLRTIMNLDEVIPETPSPKKEAVKKPSKNDQPKTPIPVNIPIELEPHSIKTNIKTDIKADIKTETKTDIKTDIKTETPPPLQKKEPL